MTAALWLESWAELAPNPEIAFRWSGQVMETQDYLALHRSCKPMDKPNVYIATGDSGMGMTHGTIAGMLISDLIPGKGKSVDETSRSGKSLNCARGWTNSSRRTRMSFV